MIFWRGDDRAPAVLRLTTAPSEAGAGCRRGTGGGWYSYQDCGSLRPAASAWRTGHSYRTQGCVLSQPLGDTGLTSEAQWPPGTQAALRQDPGHTAATFVSPLGFKPGTGRRGPDSAAVPQHQSLTTPDYGAEGQRPSPIGIVFPAGCRSRRACPVDGQASVKASNQADPEGRSRRQRY